MAIARVEDADSNRVAARQLVDRLLQKLFRNAGDSLLPNSDEPLRVQHQCGAAPRLFHGESPAGLRASSAHSGRWVAAGVAAHSWIGVDIQVADRERRLDKIAQFLNFDASARNDSGRFYSHWALREALAKARNSSVLVPHGIEPVLAPACKRLGETVSAGGYTAFVDEISPGVFFAVVLIDAVAVRACA